MTESKTIEVSVEIYGQIHSLQQKIERILSAGRKKSIHVSLDRVIQLCIEAKGIQEEIDRLVIENA